MTNEERVAVARRVVDRSGGRVPVVVGATFEGGLEQQAKLMREMGEFSDAVVIITNQIATMEEVCVWGCVCLCVCVATVYIHKYSRMLREGLSLA